MVQCFYTSPFRVACTDDTFMLKIFLSEIGRSHASSPPTRQRCDFILYLSKPPLLTFPLSLFCPPFVPLFHLKNKLMLDDIKQAGLHLEVIHKVTPEMVTRHLLWRHFPLLYSLKNTGVWVRLVKG